MDRPKLQIYVGKESPEEFEERRAMGSFNPGGVGSHREIRPHPLSDRDFPWPEEVQARWQGEDSTGCAAAVNPKTWPAEGIGRYLAATRARGERPVIVVETGRWTGERPPIYGGEVKAAFAESLDYLSGEELPRGVRARLAEGIVEFEKNLALRLRDTRPDDLAWFRLTPPHYPARSSRPVPLRVLKA